VKSLKYFLVDLDGTLILGKRVIEGALEFINFLKKGGRNFLILTNNSSKSTQGYRRFLHVLGLPVEERHIFTSGKATALFLKKKGIRDAYIIGTKSTVAEFEKNGIIHSEESSNVVLTFDTTLNFQKLAKAAKILQNRKGLYVATHPDNICPVEDGFIPDVGSFIALLKEATGRKPDYIPGKPNSFFYREAMKLLGAKREETAIVGDRLSTDIKIGKNFGITSILVLTGETTQKDLLQSKIKPDFVFKDLKEVIGFLEAM